MTKSAKSRRKKGKGLSRGHKIALAVVAALVVAMAAATLPFVLVKAKTDAVIHIHKGSTMEALNDSLAKVTDEAFACRVTTLLKLTGMKVEQRNGAFLIAEGESALKVAYTLRRGKASEITFTFNNVRTIDEFAERAAKKFEPSKREFKNALTDPDICAKFNHTPDNIACILLADSYKFYWNVSPERMLKNIYNYYQQFWTDERIAKAKKLGLTPDEVVIVASIAEEETSKADERGKVGRLYINRLKKNMRLHKI